MDRNEIKHLRIKQLAVVNGAMITVLLLFSAIIRFAPGSFAYFTLAFAILSFIYAVVALVKKDSPKSIIPLFEKVAAYEREKLGDEWYKQRKAVIVCYFIIGCNLLASSFSSWNNSSIENIQPDTFFMGVISILTLGMVNLLMLFHNRKIDHSTKEDLKGYTWKSTLIAAAVGIAVVTLLIVFTIHYIFSGI